MGGRVIEANTDFIDTLSATCRLPVHEYFQVSGVSKSRLTDNIEKRIIIIRGGISHINACVGGVGNGSNERYVAIWITKKELRSEELLISITM